LLLLLAVYPFAVVNISIADVVVVNDDAAVLTLSLTAPCDPLYLTALGLICPIKIGLICPRAVSCRPL
jgi:hypothetical protein